MHQDTGDRALCMILMVALHLALVWWWTRTPPQQQRLPETALRVHWIERPPPAATAAPAAPPPTPSPTVAGTPSRRALTMTAVEPPPASAPVERGNPPPSARDLLEQGRRWADAQAGGHDFRPDPLRPVNPAARAPDRFRMRPPPSPAAVVESIGRLLGGPGYTTDPCPQIRRNLAHLAPGGDGELLQEELRRLRQLCQ
ncbi:hypothetical protein [Luteimonas sp. R10]|uniref:hypothetical protein n=1 Tax=Luteimonas sp. R10 TaxID=3108176 RepID=UPI003086C7E6|nr:hypothetical protein U3649_00490 [Luteimonas sp. R10]